MRSVVYPTDSCYRICKDVVFRYGAAMNLPVKIRRDWHYYAFPLALYSFLMAWWGYWDLKQKLADLCRRSGDVGD